jgi:hypothetical protein
VAAGKSVSHPPNDTLEGVQALLAAESLPAKPFSVADVKWLEAHQSVRPYNEPQHARHG